MLKCVDSNDMNAAWMVCVPKDGNSQSMCRLRMKGTYDPLSLIFLDCGDQAVILGLVLRVITTLSTKIRRSLAYEFRKSRFKYTSRTKRLLNESCHKRHDNISEPQLSVADYDFQVPTTNLTKKARHFIEIALSTRIKNLSACPKH